METKENKQCNLFCLIILFLIVGVAIIACVMGILGIIEFISNKYIGKLLFLFFCAFIILNLRYVYLAVKLMNSKADKIIAVLFSFILTAFFISTISILPLTKPSYNYKAYTNLYNYTKAKKTIKAQYRINHFPTTIPNEALDIKFCKYSNSWFGSEGILLEFTSNKNYIDKELKKYKFLDVLKYSKESSQKKHKIYRYDRMLSCGNGFDIDNFTFYEINNRDNEKNKGFHIIME